MSVVPTLSVLMPMRNAEPYVEAAVRSVLDQEGVDLELIVVDDGSTDGSAAVVRRTGSGDPRVRLIEVQNGGIATALNVGVTHARGEFVARCDSDDLFAPGRLRRQFQFLRDHPEFGAVCGTFTTIAPNGKVIRPLHCGDRAEEITDELRRGKVRTSLCTSLVATEWVRHVGGYRPFFVTGEDNDLHLRLGEHCRVWFEPRNEYFYRLHDSSITHNRGHSLQKFYDDAALRFQAQRLAGELDDLQRHCPPERPGERPGESHHSSAQHIQKQLLGMAWGLHRDGRKVRAVTIGLRSLWANPQDGGAWRSVAALLVRRGGRAGAPVADKNGLGAAQLLPKRGVCEEPSKR